VSRAGGAFSEAAQDPRDSRTSRPSFTTSPPIRAVSRSPGPRTTGLATTTTQYDTGAVIIEETYCTTSVKDNPTVIASLSALRPRMPPHERMARNLSPFRSPRGEAQEVSQIVFLAAISVAPEGCSLHRNPTPTLGTPQSFAPVESPEHASTTRTAYFGLKGRMTRVSSQKMAVAND